MKTPTQIWFNRTYATNYWVLKNIQEQASGQFTLHITHKDPSSPILQAATVAGLEPELNPEDYVQWCLDYCVKNHITYFFPTHNQKHILLNAQRFTDLGVTLISPDVETINIFDDKAETYRVAEQLNVNVPVWAQVNNSDDLLDAYRRISEVSPERVIIKPTVGVGASGFMSIYPKPFSLNGLLREHSRATTFSTLLETYILSENDSIEPLMLMPWLDDPEISVDCLSSPSGEVLITVPRVKKGNRITALDASYEEVIHQTKKLLAGNPLPYVCNVQWRWFNGVPMLLEVNTRPAGGLFTVLKATGRNLVLDAINLAMNNPVELMDNLPYSEHISVTEMLTKTVTETEQPQISVDICNPTVSSV